MTTNINLTDLDFDSLKLQFKAFLQGQDQFKGYDFEGQSMNVLLDILAYNSFHSSFFVNQLFSEAFLDSAQMRASVYSHAKELNYLPKSARSSKARLRVTFDATKESQPYIIPKGSSFTALVKSRSHVFSIPETLTLSVGAGSNTFTFETDVFEGIYLKDSYLYTNINGSQIFRILNKNVDTSSIVVTVYEDGKIIGDNYHISTTLLDLDSTSKVFFLQASEDGFYEVVFGDNIIGRTPKVNSLIVVDYRVSNASEPNGATNFTINFDPTGDVNEITKVPTVTCLVASQNGDGRESLESIKYYAPRHFQVQQRGVTTGDYENILKTQFREINAVSVYGGETVTPPKYGKVFVAVDIKDVEGLPDSKVQEYFNYLKGRNLFGIDPIFVEPDYTYFLINSTVRYNLNISTASVETMKTIIMATISNFNDTFLNNFGKVFRTSQFSAAIDKSDLSVVSNDTDILVYKKVFPRTLVPEQITLKYNFPFLDTLPNQSDKPGVFKQKTVYSSTFTYRGIRVEIQDDGQGRLRIMQQIGTSYASLGFIGFVDYEKGIINLENLTVDAYDGDSIRFYVIPRDSDIQVTKQTIAQIETDTVNIIPEPIRV